MSLFTSTELTPQETLENLDTLTKKFEFDDDMFRSVHYMGNQPSGSLELHREYLRGREGYQNTTSNNYILAQRIDYIVKHATTKESLGKVIIKAQEKYPFLTCSSDDLI